MDTRNAKGKVIDPIDFTPDTIQGILPKEFALELVRRYKAVIIPKIKEGTWWDTSSSLCRDVDKVSLYIEPILLESGEDSPIYREVMRTGVAV